MERLAREASAANDRAAAAAAATEEGARARAALAADLSRGQLEVKAKEEEIRGLRVSGGGRGPLPPKRSLSYPGHRAPRGQQGP